MFTKCSFDEIENKFDYYRERDCIKKLYEILSDRATEIINYEEKMIPLTNKENKSYKEQKVCLICQKKFCYEENEKSKFELYHKVKDHCHQTGTFRGAAHSIYNLSYKLPKTIPVVIHNGSTYDYYFLIKELAEEFKGQFKCLGENTEKYITFSVPIKKEHDNDNDKTITYKLKFIDTCRFMRSKLSDLVDNLSEINNKDCKTCMERKNIKSECEFIGLKNNRLNYRCKECNGTSNKSINDLIEKFPRMHKFCNGDLNKFVLLLRKGVYPYEYMDSWERFNETSLPNKKAFYSKLNLEDITDKDHEHAQKVWEVFEIKILVSIMTCMLKVIHYCLQMYLKTLEISVLKYMDLILLISCLHQDQHGKLA